MSGFGSQPFGGSPYGIGTPARAPATGGSILRDSSTGETHGSRAIDPLTRDYVIDSYGRTLGMSDTKQLVQLAVSTDKSSSAMRTLGQALRSIDRITPNFSSRVDHELRQAVQHLVNRNLIAVIDTQVQVVREGVAFARLRWRDLSTGASDEITQSLGQ